MKPFLPFLLALLAGPVFGQSGSLVADQTTLDGILGASAYTETFSGFSLGSTPAISFPGVSTFDSSSVLDSQGPNLVAPGVTYSGGLLQWDAPGYYNATSNEILFNGGNSISITFASPTNAFGAWVRDFAGYSAYLTVTIYGIDDATVLDTYTGIVLGDPAAFFGYQNSAGIGEVTLTSNSVGWSPIISSMTFSAVPEPSTYALMLGGMALILASCARGRRGLPVRP